MSTFELSCLPHLNEYISLYNFNIILKQLHFLFSGGIRTFTTTEQSEQFYVLLT